jgi:hypothetical protein
MGEARNRRRRNIDHPAMACLLASEEPTDEEVMQAVLSQLPPLTKEQEQKFRWAHEFVKIVDETHGNKEAFDRKFEEFAGRLGVDRDELARMKAEAALKA